MLCFLGYRVLVHILAPIIIFQLAVGSLQISLFSVPALTHEREAAKFLTVKPRTQLIQCEGKIGWGESCAEVQLRVITDSHPVAEVMLIGFCFAFVVGCAGGTGHKPQAW